MKSSFSLLLAAGLAASALPGHGRTPAPETSAPYHVLRSAKVGGAGGFDYVFADAEARKLYIPRGNRVTVFDLDTLQSIGKIAATNNVHGAVVDPRSHHGFSSSHPVVMWDSQTLAALKTIDVQGAPDGILFDPATQRVFILSHRAPNLTVIDGKDGSIVGAVDIGGAPEQGATDGRGHLYFDVEDKDQVAAVDARTLKVTAHYDLGGQGGRPAGLALDAEHRLLFVCCRNPATCVILNADTGKILTALPIGAGTDGAAFNPQTGEAFSSQRDGTLTVIKEDGSRHFSVEQNVATKAGAKTLTLDSATNRLLLITADTMPAPAVVPAPAGVAPRRGPQGRMVPDSFTILVVGR